MVIFQRLQCPCVLAQIITRPLFNTTRSADWWNPQNSPRKEPIFHLLQEVLRFLIRHQITTWKKLLTDLTATLSGCQVKKRWAAPFFKTQRPGR